MDLKEFKSYFSKKNTPPMKSYAEYLIDYCGGNYMMLYDPNDRAKAICTRCRRKINLKSEVKHLKIAATDQCMRKIGILGNDGSCDLVHLSKCPNCSNKGNIKEYKAIDYSAAKTRGQPRKTETKRSCGSCSHGWFVRKAAKKAETVAA